MTEQLTGYEETSVVEVGAVLDTSPATAEEVYLRTMAYSERAIAAVAAKRAGGGGSTTLDGFAVHTEDELPLGNGNTWPPDTLDFASDNWTVDLGAGTFDLNTDDAALYLIQAQLVYRIVSNGPADNVWADITINQTTWNVDPLSFDCINSPGGINAAYWRGSIAAALPLGGTGGCQLKMLPGFHPFDTGITGAVEAQTFLRVFKIGDDPSFG